MMLLASSLKSSMAQEVATATVITTTTTPTESSNFTNKLQTEIEEKRREDENSSITDSPTTTTTTTSETATVLNVTQDTTTTTEATATTAAPVNSNKIELITDAPPLTTTTTKMTNQTTTSHTDPHTDDVGPFTTTTHTPTFSTTTTESPISSSSSSPPTSSSPNVTLTSDLYCNPSLCESYNGTHTQVLPHVACHNPGHFAATCGAQPHLLHMSERRRNLILALHNLARSRIASGQVAGYKPASHMPQIKWDTELEHLATLHVQRCSFTHDLCRNTPRFPYSGQNIGYYWIRREIKSHSRRMKNFIVNWFKEHIDANQSFIDAYHLHPEGKKIGHFTQMVADRVHRVGCAAIRYHEPDQPLDTKFLMTCNYDYTNIYTEPIYQSGPPASKCSYNISEKYPALCDWKEANYEYEIEDEEAENATFNNVRY
ncbi:allergen Tab y 5.0101-like [Musca vetustissima]|uniref:allergen Tab y 5.0101-like n=1 Tax=Musca vetustissima TaxID=27455 RepID=UPI002AB76761|nr:allergen Tab y 5.0101-like [Musca vetustissima]